MSTRGSQPQGARDAVSSQLAGDGDRPLTTAELRRRLRQTGGRGRKLRGLTALLKPYRTKVILMFVALAAATAATLAPPPLIKLAIDDGIEKGDLGTLNLVVVAFVAAALVYWVASYAQTYLVGWVGQRALQDLRLRIFSHLQSLPVGFYERRQAGQLISRMTNDVQALDSLVTDSVVTLFQSSLTLIGTMVILAYLDLELALLTFLIFPVMALASLAFRIASADAYARTRTAIGAITAYLQESLSGIRVVRSFSQEPRHVTRFKELNERNREVNMTTVNLNAAYFPAVELLSAVATVGILLYGGAQAVQGDISVGVIVAFVAALNLFFDPIQQLSQLYTTYQAGMAALDKIFDLLDEQADLVDAPDAIELGRLRGEIELRDVGFSYGTGDDAVWALQDLSLKIPPGQTVALVGATGAGKSTIAKLVARFYDPTTRRRARRRPRPAHGDAGLAAPPARRRPPGGVSVQRHDRREHRLRPPRRCIGGDPRRGPRGRRRRGSSRRSSTATTRRSASAARSSPPASASSSRSPARWPPIRAILILDEATSNVDLHTEGRIEEGLRRLLAGRTAVVIAHRLSTIRQAGRIVVLDGGRIVEQGTHDELLDAEGAYWRLYRDWMAQAAA